MEKILTVNQVAEILSVQPITVREMFREKRLRAFKVGKAWRTTETMLREDIDAMARGAAVAASETVPEPIGGDDIMAKPKRPAKQPAAKETPQPQYVEEPATPRATNYPDTHVGPEEPAMPEPAAITGEHSDTPLNPLQDTTDPQWIDPAGKLGGHPDMKVRSDADEVPPVSIGTKLMNQQEQISGARQAETQIPPESEREDKAAPVQPAADDKKPKKKKKDASDQDLFLFDGLE